jgi:endonuclease/exonuclease/phosphatase family metal-dependent hydrolase
MTFNVPPATDRTASTSMPRFVKREALDVLALQETRIRTGHGTPVPLQRTSPSLQSILDDSIGFRLPRLPPATSLQQPVVGRVPLDSMSVHPLPPDGEHNARSRYTRTTFTWQGRPAVLYNVHLHSVGEARPWTLLPEEWTSWARWKTFLRTYRQGALRRAQQARLLRRRIARESRPVMLVGDFNSTPHQWAYQHLAEGLQSAVQRRVRGWGATFPARRPLVQIDHVLVGPAWQITAARIPAPTTGPLLSDHRPVVAHLRWK